VTEVPDPPDRAQLLERLRLVGEVYATQVAVFQHKAAAKLGLGVTDMKALSILLRDGPQTAGALAARLSLTSGAVTGVIDRLTGKGLARRAVDPSDKRRVVVSVDEAALAARPNPYVGIGDAFDALHRRYATAELAFIAEYLETSTRLTAEQADALNADATGQAPTQLER
jgi:DNA-binding MarR family transcriptional regulator